VRLCLPCARWKTHGKDSLCRAPDIKRTANIITHGKDAFSRSGRILGEANLHGQRSSG
jgi:hypothetical protein